MIQICSKICIRDGRGEWRPPPATCGDQGATLDGADNGHMWNHCRGAGVGFEEVGDWTGCT
jgi:hypothetical protein